MPIEELADGLLKPVLRFLGYILLDIILELLIKGPGYLILRFILFRNQPDPDESACLLVGVIFWGIIGLAVYLYLNVFHI